MNIIDYSGNHLYQDRLCPCPSNDNDTYCISNSNTVNMTRDNTRVINRANKS